MDRTSEARRRIVRRRATAAGAGVLLLALLNACRTAPPAKLGRPGFTQRGVASWYGPGFHGKTTANGETYDMHRLTAAHRTLPFDTTVEVRNRDNGRKVRVRINDRGPFVRGRIIDLSRAAAEEIAMLGPGTARVEIRVLRGALEHRRQERYLVQAGAFRQGAEAESLASDLRRALPGVRVEIRSDGGWHRVELGPFDRRQRAEALVSDLERLGLTGLVRRHRAGRAVR